MSRTGQRSTTHPPKRCDWCGEPFWKLTKLSLAQWERAAFCSNRCRGYSLRAGGVNGGRVEIWDGDRRRYRSHVVAEAKIGRALRRGEIVHHIDGDPSNDSPDNLHVFASTGEHLAAHWREGSLIKGPGVGGSISRYRPEAKVAA